MDHSGKLFFVVGRGRSGITLLMQLLDAHSAVAMAPEALFVVSLYRRYRRATWDHATVRRFLRDLSHEGRLRFCRFDREARARDVLATPPRGYAEMCARVYAAEAAGRGNDCVRRLGDKHPLHALSAPMLMQIFPQARFIHLVRDYRDTVLSYRTVPFDASSAPVLAMRCVSTMKRCWRRPRPLPAVFCACASSISLPGRRRRCASCVTSSRLTGRRRWWPIARSRTTARWSGTASSPNPSIPVRPANGVRSLAPATSRSPIRFVSRSARGLGTHRTARTPALGLTARLGAAAGAVVTAGEQVVMRLSLAVRTVGMREYRRAADDRSP